VSVSDFGWDTARPVVALALAVAGVRGGPHLDT
jgi:hypothetical protein